MMYTHCNEGTSLHLGGVPTVSRLEGFHDIELQFSLWTFNIQFQSSFSNSPINNHNYLLNIPKKCHISTCINFALKLLTFFLSKLIVTNESDGK